MVEYIKVNVKLSDRQLKKLKTAVKKETGATLRISLKMLHGTICVMNCYWQQPKKQSLEMHLITNVSTGLTLSKAQISNIIPSGEFLGSLLSKLAGPLMKVAISLAKMF